MSPVSMVTSCATWRHCATSVPSTPCPTSCGRSERQPFAVTAAAIAGGSEAPARLAAWREPGANMKAAPPETTGERARMVM